MKRCAMILSAVSIGVLCLTGCASPTTLAQPKLNTPVAPTSQASPATVSLTQADFEIKSGQTTQDLANSFTATLTRLLNGNVSKLKFDEARDSSLDLNTFADQNVKTTMDLATDGLLIPGWQNVPSLVQWVDGETHFAEIQYVTALQTSDPAGNPQDKKMYRWSITVVSAVETSATNAGRVIGIEFTEHDNADQNRASTEFASRFPTKLNGAYGAETVTFVETDGLAKIASITAG